MQGRRLPALGLLLFVLDGARSQSYDWYSCTVGDNSCTQSCQDLNAKMSFYCDLAGTGTYDSSKCTWDFCNDYYLSGGGNYGGYTYCNPACNNAECGRQNGDCSLEDAIQKCYKTDKAATELKKAPTAEGYKNSEGKMNSPMTLFMGQMSLVTTSSPDPTFVTVPMKYSIMWRDFRYLLTFANPNATLIDCRDLLTPVFAIPNKLTIDPDDLAALNVESNYFLPKLKPKNVQSAPVLTSRNIVFTEAGVPGLGTNVVNNTAGMTPVFSQKDLESDTPYLAYPFDVHTLYMKLEAFPSVNLSGCEGEWLLSRDGGGSGGAAITVNGKSMIDMAQVGTFSESTLTEALLPASGDWEFDPTEDDGPQIKVYLEDGTDDACTVRIRLRRNPLVYTVKAFLPDLIVMIFGMSSLFINPAIPPLFGGRMSILILATLITMNSSLNRNNGLGRLSYLLKIDFVALGNLTMLLCSVVCSIAIHQCFRFEKIRLGVMLDRAVRFTLPSIIFPGVQVFNYLFLANARTLGPILFLCIYMPIAFTLITVYFYIKHRQDRAKLAKMASRLKVLDLSKADEAAKTLQEAFVLFDADGSGALDAKEGKRLLQLVNPKLPREQVARAIRESDRLGSGIVEDDFHTMIQKWAVPLPGDRPLPGDTSASAFDKAMSYSA